MSSPVGSSVTAELSSAVGIDVSDTELSMVGTEVSAGEGERLGIEVSNVGDEGNAGAAAGELAGGKKQLLQISN